MLGRHALELRAGKRAERFAGRCPTGRGTELFNQRSGEHQNFRMWEGPLCPDPFRVILSGRKGPSHFGEFAHHVELLRVHGDGEVRRQRPRRCRPDRDTRFAGELTGDNRKFHVDRRVFAVLIFDFGFGERGLGAAAPENRLQTFVNQTFLDEDREGAQDLGFVLRIEREIRTLPIAEDTEPFELLALNADKLARERFRFLAHLERRKSA